MSSSGPTLLDSTRTQPKAASPVGYECAHRRASIVVCTLGSRPTLAPCLDSLLAEVCSNSEIVLVVNTPRDERLAAELARYPVRLLFEPRRGVSAARNRALSEAGGDLVVFVDDDVTVEPGWLHELLRGFEDPEVQCVTGLVVPRGPGPLPMRLMMSEVMLSEWTLDGAQKYWKETNVLCRALGFGCNMAFRRSFLERCPLPERFGAGAVIPAFDEPYMIFRVLDGSGKVFHTPQARVNHPFGSREEQIPRAKQNTAASLAFALTVLWERPRYARHVLRELLLRRFILFPDWRRYAEPHEVLTRWQKIFWHLSGTWLFLKSRLHRRGTASAAPKVQN